MAELSRYRVRCTTDDKWEFIWLPVDEPEPTSCPANPAHGIDSAKTAIVGKSGGSNPMTSDNRPIVLTSRFSGSLDPYFAGCADDPSLGRGKGLDFILDWTSAPGSPDDKVADWSFNDWVKVAGGNVVWTGGNPGDHVSFRMYAPATVVTAASPANTGNCNLTNAGGYNLITAAAGDGTHDVADANKVPIPSLDANGDPSGHWDWDSPDEGKGSVVAAAAGSGGVNLLDIDTPLVKWIVHLQTIGSGIRPIKPETETRKVYPHWKFEVTAHNAGASGSLVVAWSMDLARKKTI